MENGKIILYQPNKSIQLEVRMESETVWLTQAQMALLFGTQRQAITKHIKNIYDCEELSKKATSSILEQAQNEGNRLVNRKIEYYNLDVIISVGYRTEERIDFFVRTSLPPVEGVFYDGQIFDAHVFVSNLIKSAKQRIILIDNYLDESVLVTLSKREPNVTAKIITKTISNQFRLDLDRHNSQYPAINVEERNNIHDRFLIIDETVYHIGASLKDLGKRLFAFSKMEMPPETIL